MRPARAKGERSGAAARARVPAWRALLALTACTLVAGGAGGCRILGLVSSEPCADDGDCPVDQKCVERLCRAAGAEGEGEGDAGSEGEGEGEGNEGEGEGEGNEGEGEGEGEGDGGALRGDPQLLSIFVTAASDCDPVGGTAFDTSVPPPGPSFLYIPAPAGQERLCTVEFTNDHVDPAGFVVPVDITAVTIANESVASLESVTPSPPFRMEFDDVMTVTMRATMPPDASPVASTRLTIDGQRARDMAVHVATQRTGASARVFVDNDCDSFGGVDIAITSVCHMSLFNTGTVDVNVASFALTSALDFEWDVLGDGPVTLIPQQGLAFGVRAQPAFTGNAEATLVIDVDAPGDPQLAFTMVGATLDLEAVDGDDCGPDAGEPRIAACAPLELTGTTTQVASIRNAGATVAVLVAAGGELNGPVAVQRQEQFPFIIAPGETRTMPIEITPAAGTGAYNVRFDLFDSNLLFAPVVFQIELSGNVP